MHDINAVSIIEEFLDVIFLKCIIIDGSSIHIFAGVFCVFLAYSRRLCQINYLVLLIKKEVIHVFQMNHIVMPLRRSPILENLLSEVGIFLPNISCCQIKRFNIWKFKIKMLLASMDLWDIVDGSEEASPSNADPKVLKEYQRRIKKAMSIITLNLADN